MSRYNVFDGGNELRHYDDFTSGISGYDNVRPAQHHIERQRHILFHVNTGDRPFTAEWNPLVVENNDELVTHLIGAGWVITGVGFHVKQAATGKLRPVIELGDGTKVNLAAYDAAVQVGEVGSYANTAEVDLTQVGFTWLRPVKDVGGTGTIREVMNPAGVGAVTSQYQAARVAGDQEPAPMGGCFGIILELVYLEDERACNCVSTPCPTVFPDPICAPKIGP